MRAFIAIELPDIVKQNIAHVTALSQQHLAGLPVRMVQIGNVHLTLNFLGDVSTSDLARLQSQLIGIGEDTQPFDLLVSGLGAFPNFKNPRVIWVGIGPEGGENYSALVNLQQRIRQSIRTIGLRDEERAFRPHLTIGRISQNAGQSELHQISEVVKSITVKPLGSVHVDQFCLMRSDLKPEGPVYTKISIFQFKTFLNSM